MAATVSDGVPGAGLNAQKMPGHWLLARMGKRVLRPGGRAMTHDLIERLGITKADRVVEFAPGMGATAQLLLSRGPAAYTGVEQDAAAAARVRGLLRPGIDECREASATDTGLPSESVDVVMGEAFLTMQLPENKQRMVAEAFRILRPGGRYGLHELCLRPEDLPQAKQDEVRRDMSESIRVGARPLTVRDWRELIERTGFEVRHESTVGMLLLEPKRLVEDEGWRGAARVVANVLRDPAARQRVRAMRATFRRHKRELGAVALVARKPLVPRGE